MYLGVEAVGNRFGGGATVLTAFLSAAVAHHEIECVTVFSSPQSERRFELPDSPKLQDVPQYAAERSYLERMAWYERGLERACRSAGVDSVICMNGMGVTRDIPSVTFIQQSLPFSKEAKSTLTAASRARIATIRLLMRRSCRRARGVIAQTPTMSLWTEMAFGLRGLPIEAIMPTVALPEGNALPDTISRRLERTSSGRRVLYVGNDAPYKQLSIVLEGFEQARRHAANATLFLAGPAPRDKHIPSAVEYLRFLPREQLATLYTSTDILLVPALVESCPMPMLEAMSLGIPILAADRPYALDVYGKAIARFNPWSATDLGTKLAQLLNNPSAGREMAQVGMKRYARIAKSRPYTTMVDRIIEWTHAGLRCSSYVVSRRT
jgi:glycosyltransferase involved in cell wall biosynthesis